MKRSKKPRVWALIMALALVAAACGSDGDSDGGDASGADEAGDTDTTEADTDDAAETESTDPETDSEAEADELPVPECSDGLPDQLVIHQDEPLIEDKFITVLPQDLDVLDLLGSDDRWTLIVSDGSPTGGLVDQTITLADVMEQEYGTLLGLVEQLTGDDVALDRWNEVESRISTLYLPSGGAAQLLTEFRAAGLDANPVHVVFPSNHIGAYPGAAPFLCSLEGWDEEAASGSTGGPTIGVVDTNLLSDPRKSTYAENDPDGEAAGCRASHGEFVASVVRQLEPSASIEFQNAFYPTQSGDWNCWRSNGWLIRMATTNLPLDALDALNYSFGTELYEEPIDEDPVDDDPDDDVVEYRPASLQETILMARNINEDLPIYAAAGNMLTTDRIYPAAFDDVIGVAARSESGDWILWDNESETTSSTAVAGTSNKADQVRDLGDGPVEYSWIDIYAPGCDLIAGATGVPDQIVVWSGSSFATPVAAALAIAAPATDTFTEVDYLAITPSSLYRGAPDVGSQCG